MYRGCVSRKAEFFEEEFTSIKPSNLGIVAALLSEACSKKTISKEFHFEKQVSSEAHQAQTSAGKVIRTSKEQDSH
jgi:hypothetical protein